MNNCRTFNTTVVLICLISALANADPQTAKNEATSHPVSIPGVEKQDLFEARVGGYTTYRIPGLVFTGHGALLAYCEARKGKGYDWDPIEVLLRRSTDGGRTFNDAKSIATAPADAKENPVAIAKHLGGHGVTLNNPVLIAGPDQIVHFVYCVNYGRCFYCRSDDDGKTFSTPVEITATFEKFRPQYDWKVIGTGPGHGIRLVGGTHAGRLVIGIWISLGTGDNGHRPSDVATIYSDDSGKTWQAGDIFAAGSEEIPNPGETVVVQLSDGRVMLNSRTESPKNLRLVTIGPDGATGWSHPFYDPALFEPICFASVIRLEGPDAHGALVFSNPDSSAASGKKPGMKMRKNLTLRLSEDNGQTWPIKRALEPGIAAYSDLACAPDGTIFCLYERGGIHNMFDTQFLTLARIPPHWLSTHP